MITTNPRSPQPPGPAPAPARSGRLPSARRGSRSLTRRLEGLELRRATDDRVLSGVAEGLARPLGVDTGVVRLAFVVTATAGGAGVVLYLLARALMPEAEEAHPVPVGPVPSARRAVGLAFFVAGGLLLLRAAGIWIADALTWSVGLAAVGSAVVWTHASQDERTRWRRALDQAVGERALPDLQSLSRIRLAVGALLLLGGIATFVGTIDLAAAPDVLLAAVVVVVGTALVVGPWLQSLARQAAQERRERIRADERADMAAHLHDSVLQTLALIQRADSPEEMARLARGQERDLRAWLFGRRPDDRPTRLGEAIQDAAGRVEDRWGVKVEVVLAGDLPLDEQLEALVGAASEAMANAGRHAGVERVDVFLEVAPDEVSVFVRDEGSGFDAEAVGGDRRGLAESVRGRMQRHGGSAVVHSAPGEGTEVELRLPRFDLGSEDPDSSPTEQPTEEEPSWPDA